MFISVDMLIQLACIMCMVLGVASGRNGIVTFGGFILLYSFLKETTRFDDLLEDGDDIGNGDGNDVGTGNGNGVSGG